MIWKILSGFEEHRKKVCEVYDRGFKLTVKNKVYSSRRGCKLSTLWRCCAFKEIICHGKVIHNLIKPNMGVNFECMCINIIVEHISSSIPIINKEG